MAVANTLNCKVGRLAMKYLGFWISHKRVGMEVLKTWLRR